MRLWWHKNRWISNHPDGRVITLFPFNAMSAPLPHYWLYPPPPPSICVSLQRNCLFTWAKNKSCDWGQLYRSCITYGSICFYFHFSAGKKSQSPPPTVLEWAPRHPPPNRALDSVTSAVCSGALYWRVSVSLKLIHVSILRWWANGNIKEKTSTVMIKRQFISN